MNREIKFRVYNPDSKLMLDIPNVEGSYLHFGSGNGFLKRLDWYASNGMQSVAYSDRSFLMQFTGLLDKNEKEIYGSDLLKIDGVVVKVEWYGGAWTVEYFISPKRSYLSTFDETDVEVIGNIYENPELLKL